MSSRTVICISFRENEMWLYEKLKTFSCPSGTVKDILKEYFNQTTNKSEPTTNLTTNTNLGLIDF